MRLWMRAAGDGLHPTTAGGDTPQRAYRLRRDTHLRWFPCRHRLQVPVSRVMSPLAK